jgi:hypothetical protein
MDVFLSPYTCTTVLQGGCWCLEIAVYAHCMLYNISQGTEMGAHLKLLFYHNVTLDHVVTLVTREIYIYFYIQ